MADSRFGELMKELNTQPVKVEIKELSSDARQDAGSFLQQKQFELAVEMAMKKLEMKIDGLREEIVSLKKELAQRPQAHVPAPAAHIQNASEHVQQGPHNQVTNDSIKVPDDVQVEGFMMVKAPSRNVMSSTADHARGSTPTVHPRLGNYTTEDVNVEKFFNFGRK